MAQARKGVVTMKGKPLTLQGPALKVGDVAPDFTVVDRQWNRVSLSDLKGKVVLISSVVSVDTSVCAVQTKRFNEEAAKLPGDVVILALSDDLPFALGRYCGAEGVDRIQVLSDHLSDSFGKAYGVLINEMRLLTRAIFVVDTEGRIAYVQIVPEVTDHPDYGAALGAVRQLLTES
jgi:thiol peroxidase